jgi:hypothetical protein
VLARASLELGDQQRCRDVPQFQRGSDPAQVFPGLVDQVDLGVVLEQRARERPAFVMAGCVRAPEPLLVSLAIRGESRSPTASNNANVASVWPWLSVACSKIASSLVLPRISSRV